MWHIHIPRQWNKKNTDINWQIWSIFFTSKEYNIRYLFNTCSQNGRPFDDFLIDLRNKPRTCEFENLQDSLICDRIVCWIDDKNISERLLRDNNLTLDRAAAIFRASETSKSQVHELDGKTVDAIRRQNS